VVIIADTTALIALENAGHFQLLELVFGELIITPIVATEWGAEVPVWIKVLPVKDNACYLRLKQSVDAGEASSLALALEVEDGRVLTDDRKARLLAEELHVPTTGTLAVLLLAKEQGHIPSVRPVIMSLQQSGFRISPVLVEHVLSIADEPDGGS
jgi:predicted nucleic acid-binding protein